ncbi:glucose 1-dehydrogenase [Marinitenerispora sediminis]|uniref:Short-chain dehydrogenase n=1 Tax=Marinitenerispora sediminis TaxID=1931232 RepID=A0A368T328_9ACTN|nr:glucose 1-dehydrogenase [Marinitenerispora sediminis]RCV49410.1 short-chain dehydrogenase [Marinitenerispora sediminis]RCV52500.1 short-chain dehydrogenase [Marinitenerispora sediminis]RCV56639.1 short-chain dehydrogenase [Marinitenerispora sediminis]
MSERFSGRTVLVTGGGSGIGRHTAVAFAREGAHVVVAGRDAGKLAGTVELVAAAGGSAHAVTADVTRAADAERLVAAVVERRGRLDVAVNNAGYLAAPAPLAELDAAEWARMLDVNVTGVWLSMKYEIAHMRDNGGGAIVNVSSTVGTHRRVPGLGGYGASKAAVTALTKAAALENIGDGIRINAVSPGSSDTAMSLRPGETEADRAERVKGQIPIGRVGELDEIASAILWAASDGAGFAVGHDLLVDGGAAL